MSLSKECMDLKSAQRPPAVQETMSPVSPQPDEGPDPGYAEVEVVGHVDLTFLLNRRQEEEPPSSSDQETDLAAEAKALTDEPHTKIPKDILQQEFLGLLSTTEEASDLTFLENEIEFQDFQENTDVSEFLVQNEFFEKETREPEPSGAEEIFHENGPLTAPEPAAEPVEDEPWLQEESTTSQSWAGQPSYETPVKNLRLARALGMTFQIGLDVGTHSIKYVVVQKRRASGKVVAFGIVQNPFGSDATAEKLVGYLTNELGLKQKFTGARISWAVSGPEIGVRRKTMPSLKKKMLQEAIFWAAKKEFGFEDTPAVIDYQVLGNIEKKGTPQIDLLVLGAREEVVMPLAQRLLKEKFVPYRIRPLPVALWYLFSKSMAFKKEGCHAVIDIGHSKTTLAFIHDGKLEFSREIPTGGRDITDALMGTIFYQGEPYQFTRQEAEWLKLNYGFPDDSVEDKTEKGVPVSEYSVLIRPILERLGNEIQRSIDYYRENFGVKTVEMVFLTGGTARLKNLIPFLKDFVESDLELLPPPAELDQKLSFEDAERFSERYLELSVAYALAAHSNSSLNLLPPSFTMLEKLRFARHIGIYLVLLGLVGVGLLSGRVWLQSSSLQSEYRIVQLNFRKMQPLKQRFDRLRLQQNQLVRKKLAYGKELVLDNPLPPVLKVVANLFPRGMALTRLEIVRKRSRAGVKAGAGKKKPAAVKKTKEPASVRAVQLAGICNHPRPDAGIQIANYMLNLRKTGLFKSVVLKKQEYNDKEDQLLFNIQAEMKE